MNRTRAVPGVLLLASVLVAGLLVVYRLKNHPEAAPSGPIVATVLPQKQQVLKGWGCYPSTFQLDRPNANNFHIFNRPNAQRLIFKELGMSLMRCNILPRSYDAHKDDGSLDTRYLDASLVRHLEMARHYGVEKYLLTVWSPPALFKDPPVVTGQDPKTHRPSRLKPEREADYCHYVVKVLDYLTKQKGLHKPVAYSIQNEPGYDPTLWDGVAYPAEQWRRVFKAMRHALDAGGYADVPLVGPECGSYSLSVDFVGGPDATALMQDKEFAAAMAGFAYHGYTYLSRKAPYPQQLRAVALTAKSLGKEVWMTEWSIIAQKRTSLEHALEVAQRLGRETAYIPSNYWFWWQGWYYQHPKGEVLLTGVDDKHLHISKSYYLLRKLWHSAPAGSVVRRVQTNDPAIKGFDPYNVQTVAFDYHGQMTVMLVNTTAQPKSLTLKGLSGTKATAFLTDETRDMASQGSKAVVQGATGVSLPPRSIVLVATAR